MGLDVFLGGGCRAWSKAPDLRSGDAGLRGFESLPPHTLHSQCGIVFLLITS